MSLERWRQIEEQNSRNRVIFLQNLFDELRRRVPAGSKN